MIDTYMEAIESAFNAARNQADWKAPINTIVPFEMLHMTVAAIEFYTATTPRVVSLNDNRFRLTSPGYRNGPAGDH